MAGLAHATGMRSGRPLANDAHDKQWYTLVKLDEYGGVGHVVNDRELQELEDLILSGEDPSDDSSFNDGQTLSGDESREDDSVDGEEPYSEDTGPPLRLPVQVAAYQKPGGPCDHCGAQGATRASLPRFFFSPGGHRAFPSDPMASARRSTEPRARASLEAPRRRETPAICALEPRHLVHALTSSSLPFLLDRLPAVAPRARVETDALQRVRDAIPTHEQPRKRAVAPGGRQHRGER